MLSKILNRIKKFFTTLDKVIDESFDERELK